MKRFLLLVGRPARGAVILDSAAASISGTDITVTATSSVDLSSGVFGVEYGVGRAAGYVFSVADPGAAANQSITIGALDGVSANDIVNVRCYYNLDPLDPSGTRVYANAIVPVLGARGVPTGTTTEGQTLTAPVSTEVAAAGASAMTIAYQWVRGASTDIPGATNSTYVLVAADVGNTIKMRVTETNSVGAVSVTSSATAAVIADVVGPSVLSVTSNKANGTYTIGEVIDIRVTFDEAVIVTGTPQIQLETGVTDRQVDYSSGSGSTELVFNYTVQATDTSSDLDYKATDSLTLNGGTMKDAFGNDATLTLPALPEIAAVKAIVIDTTAPVLSLPVDGTPTNDGATDFGVTTDEGNGTLYWGTYADGSSPTAAQVKAHTGAGVHAGVDTFGSVAVSGAGAQVIADDITGLELATDYDIFFMHEDAVGNQSAVTHADLTTTGAAAYILLNNGIDKILLNATGSILLNTTDSEIGALTDRVTITGTEEIPMNRAGADRKATMTELKTYING